MKYFFTTFYRLLFVFLFLSIGTSLFAQHVIIAVIDGARYSETFAAESTYIPFLWNHLRPRGTIWTNFRNEGLTKTAPGHASIETGVWQNIDNAGQKRPVHPTFFEYYRKEKNAPQNSVAVVVGKKKLEILAYSSSSEYGKKYGASFTLAENDTDVLTEALKVLKKSKPKILLLNFPDVDHAGHAGNWNAYLAAIKNVDSLLFVLWHTLQADPVYKNTTTLFITNDHGRHDDNHGGFADHGCECEGCQHIMLLAIGNKIPSGVVVDTKRTQLDIAPTVAELLSFSMPTVQGQSLLQDIHTANYPEHSSVKKHKCLSPEHCRQHCESACIQ